MAKYKIKILILAIFCLVYFNIALGYEQVYLNVTITAPSVIEAGDVFFYIIELENPLDDQNAAEDVVVADMLPHDVEFSFAITDGYIIISPEDSNPPGGLLEVEFESIVDGETKCVEICVKAPDEAPLTLYNNVLVRSGCTDNIFKEIKTYIGPSGC